MAMFIHSTVKTNKTTKNIQFIKCKQTILMATFLAITVKSWRYAKSTELLFIFNNDNTYKEYDICGAFSTLQAVMPISFKVTFRIQNSKRNGDNSA